MKMLEYYKIYSWMIYEFGAGDSALIAYAFLYSFYDHGKQCAVSLSSIASVLRCSRRQAIRIMNRLDREEYVRVCPNGKYNDNYEFIAHDVNSYEINVEKAVEMQRAFRGSDIDDTRGSDIDDTRGSDIDDTRGSDIDDTRGSDTDVTQKEKYNREYNREGKRECVSACGGTRTPTGEPKQAYGANGLVKLTDSEYQQLRALDYAYGRTLDSYFDSMEQMINKGNSYGSHFIALRSWITADEKKSHEESSLAFRYDADGNERGQEAEWELVYNPWSDKYERKRKRRYQ